MERLLIICLSLFWTVAFGLAAAGEIGLPAGQTAADSPTAITLAVMCVLAAALFLWMGLAVVSGDRIGLDVSGDVTRLALAGGVLVATGRMVLSPAPEQDFTVLLQLVALAATYLVVRAEEARRGQDVSRIDYSHAVARRLAIGAAHGSMLSSLSRRGPDETPGKEV